MDQKEKRKKLESFWRKHVIQFECSELSCKAYCSKNNLTVHKMGYWKARIKQLDSQAKGKGRFTKVRIQGEPLLSKTPLKLSLSLPNGIVINLALASRHDLTDVIQQLASS